MTYLNIAYGQTSYEDNDALPPRDVGIVWLDTYVADVAVTRPMGAPPANTGADPIGIAGWSEQSRDGGPDPTFNNLRRSHIFLPPSPILGHTAATNGEALWMLSSTVAGIQHGDSGGPIFIRGANGARAVFGVASRGTAVGEETWYADITSTAIAIFLNEQLVDRNRPGGDAASGTGHSDAWYVKHGKFKFPGPNGEPAMWWGEVDYTGICQQERDTDCDHWYNEHDTCVKVFNPEQLPIPGDDPDGDNRCNADDNCPKSFNPEQENCNFEYEEANRLEILGDACDPVPCPAATMISREISTGGPSPSLPSVYSVIQDEISIRPVGPHVKDPVSVVPGVPPAAISPADPIPTKVRYCQDFRAQNDVDIRCEDAKYLNNNQLRDDLPASQRSAADKDYPWQRVTLREIPIASTDPYPIVDRESNDGFLIRYQDGAQKSLYWDYATDTDFWYGSRNLFNYNADARVSCAKNTLVPGGCLRGVIWTHADTPIGDWNTAFVGTTRVGVHGPDLANHITPVKPNDGTVTDAADFPEDLLSNCDYAPFGCSEDFVLRMETCPVCADILKQLAGHRVQVPIVRGPFRGSTKTFGVIWGESSAQLVNMGISPAVQQALVERTFVTAVETARPRSGEVDAVGYPNGTWLDRASYLMANASVVGGVMLRSSFASGALPPSTDGQAVASEETSSIGSITGNLLSIYSRTMGGVFVLGFKTTGSSAPSVVYYEPIDGMARQLSGQVSADAILAATLTNPTALPDAAQPSYLWTVESQGTQRTVNVRSLTRSSISHPFYRSVIDYVPGDIYAFSVAWDSPDTVLLTVANPSALRWGVFEIDGLRGLSALAFRPILRASNFPWSRFLLRGIYAEEEAMVIPLLVYDSSMGKVRPTVERRAPRPLWTLPTIPSTTIRASINN